MLQFCTHILLLGNMQSSKNILKFQLQRVIIIFIFFYILNKIRNEAFVDERVIQVGQSIIRDCLM